VACRSDPVGVRAEPRIEVGDEAIGQVGAGGCRDWAMGRARACAFNVVRLHVETSERAAFIGAEIL
jgi:hypothetical protein